jgi:hypothetical protein
MYNWYKSDLALLINIMQNIWNITIHLHGEIPFSTNLYKGFRQKGLGEIGQGMAKYPIFCHHEMKCTLFS